MDEREMLGKTAESAQGLCVPEALKPEQIRKRLEGRTYRKWSKYRMVAAAACVCLCFAAAGLSYQDNTRRQALDRYLADSDGAGHGSGNAAGGGHGGSNAAGGGNSSGIDGSGGNGSGDDGSGGNGSGYGSSGGNGSGNDGSGVTGGENGSGNLPGGMEDDRTDHAADDADPVQETPVKKLGNMYTLASDYGKVYDVLKKTVRKQMEWKDSDGMDLAGTRKEDSVDVQEVYNGKDLMSGSREEAAIAEDKADTGGKDYSSTNLQVEGVDESDFVKTDGSFIYVVQDAQIQIVDVRGKIPAVAGTIRPKLDEDTDRICEMYVADQMLTVIVQAEETALDTTPTKKVADLSEGAKQEEDTDLQQETCLADKVQIVNTTAVTKVITYDLTDPCKPVLKDTTEQDGWYKTSRKIGSRLYLFTNQLLGAGIVDGIPRDEALKEDGLKSWLPSVNGKVVSEDCIYLPKEGNGGLLMSAVDLADHHRVLDQKLLVNNYAELYVTSHSVYLYERAYVNEAFRTRIARFTLEADGKIQAKAAKTVKGNIEDTFAIHERNGYLQVLTSVTDQEPWENRVYVLDEKMEVTGKLTGLAKGEQIYAARFAGEIGYFVTYRNTDPLFTVDFSDPQNPKVIGELKVTGFSEYLHFWSDDRLLGIGMETDPQSGETVGVKLSMFDISDPGKVKEEAKLVLKGATYCEGMYDYKAVLADPEKNLIAFTTETYQQGYREAYRVVSYKNGKFLSRVDRTLAAGQTGYESGRWRSVYVKDLLYLVGEKKALVFDMSDGWRETGKLKYGYYSR